METGSVPSKVKWHSRPEKCDVCQSKFKEGDKFYDAKMKQGPWALMCWKCFKFEGFGLGTGRGQRYDWDTLEKEEG